MRRLTVALPVLLAAACATSSPAPSTAPLNSEGMPAGRPTRIDLGVVMSPDNRGVFLRFVGGVIVPPTDPCNTEYAGWARPEGDVLQVAVVLLPDRFDPPSESVCAAAGMERVVQVALDEPFTGQVAVDTAFGSEIVIQRP